MKNSTTPRREFLAGGLALAGVARAQPDAVPSPRELKIAIIGCGTRGTALINRILRLPGIRPTAIADIWEYRRTYGKRYAAKFGYKIQAYEDYREMLREETDLDAVLIATPDIWHAPIAVAAFEAGLHVYCERPMAHTIKGARDMVQAMRKSGKLLQVGTQRRSHPTFRHLLALHQKHRAFGNIAHMYAHSSDLVAGPRKFKEKYHVPPEVLAKWGYASMADFLNWRFMRKHGGGPLFYAGSQDLDFFLTFFGERPTRILASGGKALPVEFGFECPDNLDAILEFSGDRRATLNLGSNSPQLLSRQRLIGSEGEFEITLPRAFNQKFECVVTEFTHMETKPWLDRFGKKGLLHGAKGISMDGWTGIGIRWSVPEAFLLPEKVTSTQLHLENFFDAILTGVPLNSSGDHAIETMVTMRNVLEAVDARKPVELTEEDFRL